jgi:hypothetical protein
MKPRLSAATAWTEEEALDEGIGPSLTADAVALLGKRERSRIRGEFRCGAGRHLNNRVGSARAGPFSHGLGGSPHRIEPAPTRGFEFWPGGAWYAERVRGEWPSRF